MLLKHDLIAILDEKNMKKLLRYLYRDAGNNKVYGEKLFGNKANIELSNILQKIEVNLIDELYFVPEKWGVPRLSFSNYVPELDHEWHEFESAEEANTNDIPKIDVSEFMEKLI